MDVYVYAAALLCEECGVKQRELIRQDDPTSVPADPDDEASYDSGDFPKGPVADGGGESDAAEYCGQCSVFLENPLTSDGRRAVARLIAVSLSHLDHTDGHERRRANIATVADFYDLDTVTALLEALS